MLILDYPSFNQIVNRVAFDRRSPLYFFEDDKKFVIFFSDGNWEYMTEVMKEDLVSFVPHSEMDRGIIDFLVEFRRRNLEGAIRLVGYTLPGEIIKYTKPVKENKKEIVEVADTVPEEVLPTDPEKEAIVDEVNKKIKAGEM